MTDLFTEKCPCCGQALQRHTGGRFQEFWDQYPHRRGAKKGRKPAETKYKAALKAGATEADIIAGAVRYASDAQVIDGYAKGPAVWLHNRGWEDDIEPARPKPTRGPVVNARAEQVAIVGRVSGKPRSDLF